MKRKFLHEYAFGYLNSLSILITAQSLMEGGTVDEENAGYLSNCHIYFICTRPAFYFIENTIKHENDTLSGEIGYKIDGNETRLKFSREWKIDEPINISCKYPFRDINSINSDGDIDTYVTASLIAMMNTETHDYYSETRSYEVLYIGKAVGKNGSRSAIDRLKSHSTLQRVLADIQYKQPDKEVAILMYAFDHETVFSSFDGRSELKDDNDKNNERFKNAVNNKPSKNQSVAMIEAALIKYFQPEYNDHFKKTKIHPGVKALSKCYDIDMSGLVVELNTENLFYSMYSKLVNKSTHHLINIDLVSHQNRASFFRPAGLSSHPGLIE